jgi:hypothetical protein
MAMRGRILMLAAALSGLALAGAGPTSGQRGRGRSAGPLLASEMSFEQRGDRRRAVWTADPLLASYPEVVRALRAEALPQVRPRTEECSARLACFRSLRDELALDGPRLLSIFRESNQYLDSAHSVSWATDWIYDKTARRRIRFGDLFRSWSAARLVLQQRFCRALAEARTGRAGPEITCPELRYLAFGLSADRELPVGRRATAIEMRTSDYALGGFAFGRETVWIGVDRTILDMIRPEYRGDFEVAGP